MDCLELTVYIYDGELSLLGVRHLLWVCWCISRFAKTGVNAAAWYT